MRKYNNFSPECQYKNNNPAIIIIPSVFYTNQILITHNLAAKHAVVLCYSLLNCWRNQTGWLGEERPKLDAMLSRPLKAKMVELNYIRLGKALNLAKDQLKNIFFDLEQAKLLKRVLVKHKWYILLLDEAFKMYLNNHKSKKRRINKGNIICTSWLSTLKTDGGQPDFTGALILGEIAYFSRVLKIKQPIDDYNDTVRDKTREDNALLVSKSKGLVAYFEYDHFKKKLPFIDNQTINRTLARLEKNNIISVQRIKFTRNRRVVKRLYITLNYDLVEKQTDKSIVDFIFKTEDYLNREQLTSFYQNTPAFIYSQYNSKTIIYPRAGFSNNLVSFSSFASSSCLSTINQTKPKEQLNQKRWSQVTCLNSGNNKANHEDDNDNDSDSGKSSNSANVSNNLSEGDGEDDGRNKQKTSKYQQISSIESSWGKKKSFKLPRYLKEMHTSLGRLYRTYFASFNYPLSFCCSLLDSLAKKYSDVSFKGENQFISYFKKILSQEKRASWQVKSRQYFQSAKSLAELAYEKLPNTLREKLNQLAIRAGKRIEELPELLSKLAFRNTKHLFSCVSSFLSYMKLVLEKLKSREEIQEAYSALPRVSIGEVASYLSAVEASYSRVGAEEHLRRKIASTLPMTVAYHLLSCCNFYSARVDRDKNFIIPSQNKNWAEMIRGGIKSIIKDQVAAVYGQIKTIKFVGYSRKEDPLKERRLVSENNEASVRTKEIRTAVPEAMQQQLRLRYAVADAANEPSIHHSAKPKLTPYELFQKRRLEFEQRERKELAAKMLKEEQELREQGNVNPGVYERYKQAVADAEIEKAKYIKQGGDKDKARELYKVLSFSEWMQLQELIGMA